MQIDNVFSNVKGARMSPEKLSTRKLLLIGCIGAVLSLAGDFFIGWQVYPDDQTYFAGMMMGGEADFPVLRMTGAVLGAIGIPLQFFGFAALARLVADGNGDKAKKRGRTVSLGAWATAFFGGAVHVLCVAAMLLFRMECEEGFDPGKSCTALGFIPELTLRFILIVLLPVSLVCMIPYILGQIALFISVEKGETVLPRWACLFNPLTAKLVLNVISAFLPNTGLCNALLMSNMGIGGLLTFAGVLLILDNDQ